MEVALTTLTSLRSERSGTTQRKAQKLSQRNWEELSKEVKKVMGWAVGNQVVRYYIVRRGGYIRVKRGGRT